MQKVKILKRVGRQLYRSSPTILTVVASIGVIATTITAVQATPKAIKLLKEAELEKGENLTKLEIVRVAGPTYIPSVLLGVSTIACIFGAVSYTHLDVYKRQVCNSYIIPTLLLHPYSYTKNKLFYFFYIFSQPFQISDSISRFCYVLYGMSNHFFKCILIHTGFFPHRNKGCSWIMRSMIRV